MTSKLPRRSLAQGVLAAGAAGALSRAKSFAAVLPKNVGRLDGVQLAIVATGGDGFGMHRQEPAFLDIPDLGFTNVKSKLWYSGLITPRYIESIQARCYQAALTCVSGRSPAT